MPTLNFKKKSIIVHILFYQGVNIGIDPQNLAQQLLLISFVTFFKGNKILLHKRPNLHNYKMTAI